MSIGQKNDLYVGLKDFYGFFMIKNHTWVTNVGHLGTRMMGPSQGLDQLSSDWNNFLVIVDSLWVSYVGHLQTRMMDHKD